MVMMEKDRRAARITNSVDVRTDLTAPCHDVFSHSPSWISVGNEDLWFCALSIDLIGANDCALLPVVIEYLAAF
jgi:hypothetical protein